MTRHIFELKVEAAGTVRKCQPYSRDSTCPACGAAPAPRWWRWWRRSAQPHPVANCDETFVWRTCLNCGTRWREFHTDETRGKDGDRLSPGQRN